jgi:hypothetical protein
MRIIVTGLIAQYPLGGVTWDYVQYVLGLARLGHDVYYIEDTGQWPYNPIEGGLAKDCTYNVQYLATVMSRCAMDGRWAYRFPWQSQWFGMPEHLRHDIVRSADLLINVSGTLHRPEEYRAVRLLAYIDTDPVFTQVKLARGQTGFARLINAHDIHFSFGERLNRVLSSVPDTGHHWRPTRQPIVLSEWRPRPSCPGAFTTVMNWTSYKPLTLAANTYGQKDLELQRFMTLPQLVAPTVLELAVNAGKTTHTPRELLKRNGWRVADPDVVCSDMERYRDYVETSRAEWSVAKNGYVVGQAGWFSCRSACYLAAGKPVAVQDTGFSDVLPVGKGLLAFRTLEEAAAAIREIEIRYLEHAAAARRIAEEFFDSGKVLTRLITEALEARKESKDSQVRDGAVAAKQREK